MSLAKEIEYLEYQLASCPWSPSGHAEAEELREDLAKLRGKQYGIALREKNRVTGRNFLRAR